MSRKTVPGVELKEWRDRADLREKWEAFIKDEAFIKGYDVLDAYNRSQINMGEPLSRIALRQSYQAGYEACLKRMRRLPELFKTAERGKDVEEWGGDLIEINDTNETN